MIRGFCYGLILLLTACIHQRERSNIQSLETVPDGWRLNLTNSVSGEQSGTETLRRALWKVDSSIVERVKIVQNSNLNLGMGNYWELSSTVSGADAIRLLLDASEPGISDDSGNPTQEYIKNVSRALILGQSIAEGNLRRIRWSSPVEIFNLASMTDEHFSALTNSLRSIEAILVKYDLTLYFGNTNRLSGHTLTMAINSDSLQSLLSENIKYFSGALPGDVYWGVQYSIDPQRSLVKVIAVIKNFPAAIAGLKEGDFVTKIAGEDPVGYDVQPSGQVRKFVRVQEILRNHSTENKIKVVVARDNGLGAVSDVGTIEIPK